MNYLKLIRPLNLLMMGLAMYLFRLTMVAAAPYRLMYIRHSMSEFEFLMLVLATLFIAAGGYVINDIFDADIDKVNRPGSVIVGVKLTETAAYNFYKLICALAVVCVFVLAFKTGNYRLSTLPLIIMVILNFYAHTFKKQLIVGNFMISLCTAFTIWLIALFESGSSPADLSPDESYVQSGIAIGGLVYGLFAFLSTLLREVVKDAEDREGDRQFGARTIAVVWGRKGVKAASALSGLVLLLILVSFACFFPSIEVKNVSIFIIIGLIIPLIAIIILIFKADSARQYHFISNFLKIFMSLGIASMLYFRSGIGPYIFVQYANFLKKLF